MGNQRRRRRHRRRLWRWYKRIYESHISKTKLHHVAVNSSVRGRVNDNLTEYGFWDMLHYVHHRLHPNHISKIKFITLLSTRRVAVVTQIISQKPKFITLLSTRRFAEFHSHCSQRATDTCMLTRKLCYCEDDRAICLIHCIWVPWKFLNVHRKFEMHSLSRSWDNSDLSFGWAVVNPNLKEEEVIGCHGWYHLKDRWWLPIGPP